MQLLEAPTKLEKLLNISGLPAANTNRWDPILNYPGSKEVVSCHHQYLKHYWSDFYDFGIILI